MRKISSRSTWCHKKASPVLSLGFLGLFTVVWTVGVILQRVPAPTLLIPLALTAVAYSLLRWLVFPLIDEVFIDEDQIIVRNRGQEDRFPISTIVDVEYPLFVNPERIVLTLKEPCRFGHKIVFLPPYRLWPFSRHPLAEELTRRAHGIDEKQLDGLS